MAFDPSADAPTRVTGPSSPCDAPAGRLPGTRYHRRYRVLKVCAETPAGAHVVRVTAAGQCRRYPGESDALRETIDSAARPP